jgi:hypothetical protein
MLVIVSLIGFVTINPVLHAAKIIPIEEISEVEGLLYGKAKKSSLMKRIVDIEKTLYGKKKEGTLIERSSRIVNYVLKSERSPSLILVINSLEWSLTNQIGQGNIKKRLNSMENIIFGQSATTPVLERINRLVKMGLPGGKVPAEMVKLPADTLIRVKLLNKISSTSSQIGEKVNFEVVEDVKVDSKLIIPEGIQGSMRIAKVSEAGQMGQDGEVKLEFSPLKSIDGTKLSLSIREKAKGENRSQQLALGASILGTVILGRVGLITGYFVQGNEENLPAGTEMYVQTKVRQNVYGLTLD